MTEVIVTYSCPEMFGLAEARIAFDADERFRLLDGRTVSVLDLHRGMSVVMADGSVGTIIGHPERRHDIPVPPLHTDGGLWSSRVVGLVKHTAHEVLEFRWAGQVVQVTPGHEVWSADRRGWVGAHELYRGELIRVAGNLVAPVEGVRRLPMFIEVFGIEVEYFHNYFVGTGPDAMLVHNGPVCVLKPMAAEEAANLPESVLFRQIKGDHKGRPFGTQRNTKTPTVEDLNPHIGDVPAGELAGKINGRKHGIYPEQAERVKAMSNEELLQFRADDPMSGNLNATREGFSITGGHHRMNEITRRVEAGELPPDAQVRILFHD